jgi:uncharacterized membrane protein
MRDVIINVVSETVERKRVTSKLKYLSDEEKTALKIMLENKSEILQSDLVLKSGLSKYKITRMLGRFEGMELVRREKYGITNVVHLLLDDADF